MTYWISTVFTATYLLWSAYGYLFSENVIAGVEKLGFPSFFRIELAILKIVAVVIILIPGIPMLAKDWAYAGIALFYLTAIVAHIAHKDPFVITIINVILLIVLVVSYVCLLKQSN